MRAAARPRIMPDKGRVADRGVAPIQVSSVARGAWLVFRGRNPRGQGAAEKNKMLQFSVAAALSGAAPLSLLGLALAAKQPLARSRTKLQQARVLEIGHRVPVPEPVV